MRQRESHEREERLKIDSVSKIIPILGKNAVTRDWATAVLSTAI